MCGRAPGPTRQKVYSSHGRTDGFTEIFNSTDLSNSASNRMLHTSQCAVRARSASDAVRGRRVARQLGHSTSQRRFISPARVACRNNFKTSQRSARQRLATAKGRMCDSSTVRRPDQEFTQPGNERFGKFFGAQFFQAIVERGKIRGSGWEIWHHGWLLTGEMFADVPEQHPHVAHGFRADDVSRQECAGGISRLKMRENFNRTAGACFPQAQSHYALGQRATVKNPPHLVKFRFGP